MLVCAINDVLDGSIYIIQSCLDLLLGGIQKILDILNSLLPISRSGQFVVVPAYLFEALLSRIAAKQLQRRFSPSTVCGQNP